MQETNAIEMRGISKLFFGIYANRNIDLTVKRGEILSLLGENGSGKTTLMNMLSGIYFPDEGEIFVSGRKVSIRSPKDAYENKIGMIHQHFKLVDVFTAAENVILGYNEGGRMNLSKVSKRLTDIAEQYGFSVEPNKLVSEMSVSEKQTLEILKVLYRGADVLILDEPTAVLTPQESEKLFNVMRNMKADGKSIIIITHKLNEVLEISDRVAILRKGESIGCIDTKDANEAILTEMMVGEKVSLNIDRKQPVNPEKRISVSHLSCLNEDGLLALDDVSFDMYGGEILGIAGISGCGQKQLLEAIAGLQIAEEGSSITYYSPDGGEEQLLGKTPREIRNLGVSLSFVPEDRLGMGLVGSMGMTENMMLKNYNEGKSIFTNPSPSKELARSLKDELNIVTPEISTPVRQLSGGNIQKVLVGREISESPSVLLTAYAVRGLDTNTSYLIYNLLNKQKESGVSVVYVGEDMDVLLELCDRILVLCGGKVSGIVDARSTSKEQIGLLMTSLPKGGDGNEIG